VVHWFWLLKRERHLRFEEIAGIAYGYEQGGEDYPEYFVIGLRLENDEEIKVCRNPSEQDARQLVTILATTIGVSVIPYRHIGW
jgi:hypothetical protein